jgi:SLOG-like protein
MAQESRPLAGLRIGLSVAGNAEELAPYGFTLAGMNRFTVRLARALLAEGARLAFGHDWRPDGVMEAITSLAFDYHRPLSRNRDQPAILNLLPWPLKHSSVDADLLRRLEGTVEIRAAGLPEELHKLAEEARPDDRSEEYRYLRARGLTHLRRELEKIGHARVAMGGKLVHYDGRLPGIVEEVLFALESSHPVYLAGLLGGAARLLGKVILDREDPEPIFQDLRLEDTYRRRREIAAEDGDEDASLDREALRRVLHSKKLRERFLDNGLTKAENRRLLDSTLEEETILLILKGCKSMHRRSAGATHGD